MEDKDSSVIIEKVAYGLTIGDLKFGNTRPGVVEATLKPGYTLEDALDELDERLTSWHKKRYPHLYQEPETYPKPYDGKDRFQYVTSGQLPPQQVTFSGGPTVIEYEKEPATDYLSLIQSAATPESLKEYKLIAGQPGNEELYKAYNKRVKELIPSV